MATNSSDSTTEIDRLVAKGELAGAATRLEEELAADNGTVEQWLKLAGLRRALRQPRKALDAVHRALALAPLDFVALVMRASLLDRMGDLQAGQAWAEALAQRPPGELAPPLAAAVAEGERTRKAWHEARSERLLRATKTIAINPDHDAHWRVTRFRDNILRNTAVYHSEPTHFHYPGLTEREFHPRDCFPWLSAIEAETAAIREELLAVMRSDRAELVPYLQYADHEALAQWHGLNRNPDWTAIHLIRRGEVVAQNAEQCPLTMQALSRLDQPAIPGASPNAMFSLLAPGTTIPPHVGVNNARLLCHLPLVVPEGCWFRVGAETRFWQEGSAFVFDDTIEHEACNPSDQLRVVMIFDIWHPDLIAAEREAVAAMVAAEGVPEADG